MKPIEALSAPLFVSWQLTRDCDLCCLHCCTDSAPGKRLTDELSADEAMQLAGHIARVMKQRQGLIKYGGGFGIVTATERGSAHDIKLNCAAPAIAQLSAHSQAFLRQRGCPH